MRCTYIMYMQCNAITKTYCYNIKFKYLIVNTICDTYIKIKIYILFDFDRHNFMVIFRLIWRLISNIFLSTRIIFWSERTYGRIDIIGSFFQNSFFLFSASTLYQLYLWISCVFILDRFEARERAISIKWT